MQNLIYYGKNKIMKIGNFGLNCLLDYNLERENTIDIGTLYYKPPEVLLGLKQYIMAFAIGLLYVL